MTEGTSLTPSQRKRFEIRLTKKLSLMVGARPTYCSDCLVEFDGPTKLVYHVLAFHRDEAARHGASRFIRWGSMAEGERRRALGLTRNDKYP